METMELTCGIKTFAVQHCISTESLHLSKFIHDEIDALVYRLHANFVGEEKETVTMILDRPTRFQAFVWGMLGRKWAEKVGVQFYEKDVIINVCPHYRLPDRHIDHLQWVVDSDKYGVGGV